MKNNGRFTYEELRVIYYSLYESMSRITNSDEFNEEDKDILIKDLRDIAHKVMRKMDAIEDGNSY